MKKTMLLLAATMILSAGSFAQTSQPKSDTTHKTMKKSKKPMKKKMDSTSTTDTSSMRPMK